MNRYSKIGASLSLETIKCGPFDRGWRSDRFDFASFTLNVSRLSPWLVTLKVICLDQSELLELILTESELTLLLWRTKTTNIRENWEGPFDCQGVAHFSRILFAYLTIIHLVTHPATLWRVFRYSVFVNFASIDTFICSLYFFGISNAIFHFAPSCVCC